MMKLLGRLGVVVMTLALAACATPLVSNDISIETASAGQFLPGASCTVQTPEGSFNVMTPATVPVRHATGDLRVVCNRPGFRTSEVLYRGMGYGGYNGYGGPSVGLGLGGGGGNVGFGLGLGFPIGGIRNNSGPSRIVVEMTPL
nr:hypothetical protein [uncultured Noviherbaspirillum sp.]